MSISRCIRFAMDEVVRIFKRVVPYVRCIWEFFVHGFRAVILHLLCSSLVSVPSGVHSNRGHNSFMVSLRQLSVHRNGSVSRIEHKVDLQPVMAVW